jgi:hypothetical protein
MSTRAFLARIVVIKKWLRNVAVCKESFPLHRICHGNFNVVPVASSWPTCDIPHCLDIHANWLRHKYFQARLFQLHRACEYLVHTRPPSTSGIQVAILCRHQKWRQLAERVDIRLANIHAATGTILLWVAFIGAKRGSF